MQIKYLAAIEDSAGNAFDAITNTGVAGAFAVLAIIGLVLSIILLLKEKDKRIEDASKIRDNVGEPLKRIQESIERMENKIIISKARNHDEVS